MDSLGALALATKPPGPEILDRYPEDKLSWVINGSMAKMIIGQSIYQLIITIILLIVGDSIFRLDLAKQDEKLQLTTLIFNTVVMMQLFNESKTSTFKFTVVSADG
jgi:Ca2+-transporting ATPase